MRQIKIHTEKISLSARYLMYRAMQTADFHTYISSTDNVYFCTAWVPKSVRCLLAEKKNLLPTSFVSFAFWFLVEMNVSHPLFNVIITIR